MMLHAECIVGEKLGLHGRTSLSGSLLGLPTCGTLEKGASQYSESGRIVELLAGQDNHKPVNSNAQAMGWCIQPPACMCEVLS